MEKLFEIAADISTPLSLAGVALMALFILYRQLISGPLSKTLRTHQSFIIIQKIVNFIFWISIVAIFVGVASFTFLNFVPPPKSAANLHLSNTRLDRDDHGLPVVEFQIRNSGDETAIVTLASLIVKEVFEFHDSGQPAFLPVAHTYDVELETSTETPYEINVPLSQTIGPDGADRFALRIGHDMKGKMLAIPNCGVGLKSYLFLVGGKLLYNEDADSVEIPDIWILDSDPPNASIILDGGDTCIAAGEDGDFEVSTVAEVNKMTAKKIIENYPAIDDASEEFIRMFIPKE